jgi:hypothetical protein
VDISLKRVLGAATLVALLSGFAGPAAAGGTDPALKAALEQRYTAMKAAMAAHDAGALRAILAPGFASIDVNGQRQNASQMIAEVRTIPSDPHKTSATTVLSCSGTAKSLTVKQRFDLKTVRRGPDGAPHKVELVSLSTDTWVKPGAVWLMERTVTDDMTLYRDGKLAGHRARMQQPESPHR